MRIDVVIERSIEKYPVGRLSGVSLRTSCARIDMRQ
jgi:hypothetical protein